MYTRAMIDESRGLLAINLRILCSLSNKRRYDNPKKQQDKIDTKYEKNPHSYTIESSHPRFRVVPITITKLKYLKKKKNQIT